MSWYEVYDGNKLEKFQNRWRN